MEPASHRKRIRSGLILAAVGGLAAILSVFAAPVEGASGFGCFVKIFDCGKALDSRYSQVLGIPLGVLGLFYFAFWGLMLRAWAKTGWDGFRFAMSATMALGVMVSLALLGLLLFVVEGFCLFCLITHVANLGAFAALWPLRCDRFPQPIPRDRFRQGMVLTAIAAVLAGSLHAAGEIRAGKARQKAAEETIW